MSETITKKTPKGTYTLKIEQDEMPQDPRVDCDNLGTMVCFHARRNLGDECGKGKHDFPNTPEGRDEFKRWLKEEKKDHVMLPLYLYDHSGITMSCTPFSCKWDSGQIGMIYVSKKDVLENWSLEEWSDEAREKAVALLKAEVKEYDMFITGDVWEYSITLEKPDDDEEDISSCGGYYGEECCRKEAFNVLNWYVKRDEDAEKSFEEKATTSVVYLQMKIVMRHLPELTPDEIISDCDYSFNYRTAEGRIVNTRISGKSDTPWE